MNVPIPSLRAALKHHARVRLSGPLDQVRNLAAETQPLRPDHGGLEGTAGAEGAAVEDEETTRRRHRAAALAALAHDLGLSSDVELDIAIVTDGCRLQFAIRDRVADVMVLLDEADAERIVAKLRHVSGALVDRAI